MLLWIVFQVMTYALHVEWFGLYTIIQITIIPNYQICFMLICLDYNIERHVFIGVRFPNKYIAFAKIKQTVARMIKNHILFTLLFSFVRLWDNAYWYLYGQKCMQSITEYKTTSTSTTLCLSNVEYTTEKTRLVLQHHGAFPCSNENAKSLNVSISLWLCGVCSLVGNTQHRLTPRTPPDAVTLHAYTCRNAFPVQPKLVVPVWTYFGSTSKCFKTGARKFWG